MAQPSSISRRIGASLLAANRKDFETALIHFFPALDKTAKRRYPRDGVGKRIKGFLSDQEIVISAIATGNIYKDIKVDGISFPEAIYKFGRTSIAHEGELDKRIEINESGCLAIGKVWSLPASYIDAMCFAVMLAPENAAERLPGSGSIVLFGREWQINELWGAQTVIEKDITNKFKAPDLFI